MRLRSAFSLCQRLAHEQPSFDPNGVDTLMQYLPDRGASDLNITKGLLAVSDVDSALFVL